MAARNRPEHNERTRLKIKTTALLNRLQNHALGKCKMTPTQIRAAEITLRKSLPDLQAVHRTSDRDERSYESWIREMEQIVEDEGDSGV